MLVHQPRRAVSGAAPAGAAATMAGHHSTPAGAACACAVRFPGYRLRRDFLFYMPRSPYKCFFRDLALKSSLFRRVSAGDLFTPRTPRYPPATGPRSPREVALYPREIAVIVPAKLIIEGLPCPASPQNQIFHLLQPPQMQVTACRPSAYTPAPCAA